METFQVMFILGIATLGGILGAWFFQKLKIPQVMGYIAIGIIIGETGLKLITTKTIESFSSFNMFALGIIGFLVGGELNLETFKKYGKQFSAILLGEGLGAFILVTSASFVVLYHTLNNLSVALATAIVFGSIASATDPASTIEVLWEYRAKGVLTTTLIAIVALDDALAMTLYGIGTGVAEILTAHNISLGKEIIKIIIEVFGSLLVGAIGGMILNILFKKLHLHEKNLAITLGIIFIVISISEAYNMDIILATMSLGFTFVNLTPRRSQEVFKIVRTFSIPIYVLFFVLVGARLKIGQMGYWLWILVVLYVLGRSIGKMTGSFIGAYITNADKVVQKYTGLGLFAQGGVAIGLSIMATHHLQHIMITPELSLGNMIIGVVTATTFIVQLLGPPTVKLAINLAQESGKNITEKDIIETLKVEDVMDKDIKIIYENEPLSKILETFSSTDLLIYPVVNKNNKIIGIINLESFRELLPNKDCWEWVVAADIIIPIREKIVANLPLQKALNIMKDLKVDQIPVLEENNEPVGVLDMRDIQRKITDELVKRTQN